MIWLSVLFTGLALALLVYALAWPAAVHTRAHHAQLPLPVRLLWPWVCAFSGPCRRLSSWGQRERLQRRLHKAGLAHALQVGELVALHWCSALVLALAACGAVFALGFGPFAAGLLALPAALSGYVFPALWLRNVAARRQQHMLRELPFLLDMTTLCVQAGLNLHGALMQAVQYGPAGPLCQELHRALGDMRAGMPRLQALDVMAERTALAQVRSLVLALRQAEQLGMSLAPLLKAQSAQRQSERFQRAEKLALEAPVKMLLPMVACIFPCTFLVIGFPVLSRFTNVVF